LLARQAQLNAALDLDKDETQIAPPAQDDVEPPSDVLQGPAIPPNVQRIPSRAGNRNIFLALRMFREELTRHLRPHVQKEVHTSKVKLALAVPAS
jgi:hypothetical protein